MDMFQERITTTGEKCVILEAEGARRSSPRKTRMEVVE